ncbi:hypothetical protein [Aureibacter tunicatorum]|uniref:Zn-ribbon and HTH transcriptional regulator n=1 Tax=Aureibacter tunicatorum TaxID=866807 RepID=A0AAE3XTF6_9BACT|nr:hypothetical protein [Aureibacter tunicatorum]MDR6241695.1 putative Zn-ribbon and HTH transcriptional regulator [Aureibacter tunicatorum]
MTTVEKKESYSNPTKITKTNSKYECLDCGHQFVSLSAAKRCTNCCSEEIHAIQR